MSSLLACYKSSLTGFLTCLPLRVSYGVEPLTWDLSGTAAGSFLVLPWVTVASWPSPKTGTGLLISVSPEGGSGAVSVSGVSDSCSGSGCWSAPLITCMWFWTIGSQGHPVASDSTTACIYHIRPWRSMTLFYGCCFPLLWPMFRLHSHRVTRFERRQFSGTVTVIMVLLLVPSFLKLVFVSWALYVSGFSRPVAIGKVVLSLRPMPQSWDEDKRIPGMGMAQ